MNNSDKKIKTRYSNCMQFSSAYIYMYKSIIRDDSVRVYKRLYMQMIQSNYTTDDQKGFEFHFCCDDSHDHIFTAMDSSRGELYIYI